MSDVLTYTFVQTLRAHAKWCRDRLGDTHDGKLCDEAANIIERLQAENTALKQGGCARDQKTTQFCAEAVALQGEVERLNRIFRCPDYSGHHHKFDGDGQCKECCQYATNIVENALGTKG